MKLKKTLLTGLAVSLFAALGSPVFAEDSNITITSSAPTQAIEAQNVSHGFTESDVLTFNEVVSLIAKDKGVSEEEVTNQLLHTGASTSRMNLAAAQSATYRTFTSYLYAWSSYVPSLNFYCQTSESGSFHGIVKILDTTMNRVYNGISKQFSGTVYTNLENANKIHYVMSGDFYNNGTTTVTGGGEVGVGGVATSNYSVSSTSSWFGNIYDASDYFWN